MGTKKPDARMTPEQFTAKRIADKAESVKRQRLALAARFMAAPGLAAVDFGEGGAHWVSVTDKGPREAARGALVLADILLEEAES